MKGFQREDDFLNRRKHLEGLSDEELKKLFWDKIDQIVQPLLKMAKENTSPSIERSVLLRMGFSSIEADGLVDQMIDQGLMGYGAGHAVYLAAKQTDGDIRQAGLDMLDGKYWDEVAEQLKGGVK
ncbi:MAG TPA: ornithine aminomutase [Tissierellia bacterium]|nr:ornithine aminomutase [Tissierellia bacterium]